MSGIMFFDTLEYSKKAQAQGFTAAQADFQAEEMAKLAKEIDGKLATKHDIKTLKEDIKNLEKNLDERLTYRLTLRLGSVMVAGISALGVLMTILHH